MHQVASTILPYRAYLGRITATLAVLCALSVLLYGTFLLMAVAHAAKMSAARHQITKLTSTVSELEGAYLAGAKGLTRQRAADMGFVAPTSVGVVYAAAPESLSLNTR